MIDNLQNHGLPVKDVSGFLQLLRKGTAKPFTRLVPLVIGLCTMAAGHAATYTVNSTSDLPLGATVPCDGVGTCTLRAAIQAANASVNTPDANGVPQPDVINVPANTYTLTIAGAGEDQAATGDLDITESVNINGDTSATTIIDGNGLDRVFHVIQVGTTAVSVSFSKLTIQNGYVDGGQGGGLYNEGATVSLVDTIVTNNNVKDATGGNASGGGIYNAGTMDLNGVTLSNNIVDLNNTTPAGAGGGGVYNTGSLRVENSVLDGNQVLNDAGNASGGGGIQNTGVTGFGPNTTRTVITRSTISNNTAPLGGGVRNLFGRIDIDYTLIDSNSVTLSGGGVQNDSNGGMAINNSTIRNNTAPQTGGGVNNLAALDITNSSIYGNQSPGSGTVGGAGGGIFIGGAGALNLISTTVSGNQARAGGGIFNHKFLNATNATIYDNSDTSTGGGTELFTCGAGDSATGSGCDTGVTDSNGSLLIKSDLVNTIIGNGSTNSNCNIGVPDLILSKGHNLETADSCGFTASGDIINAAPSAVFADPTSAGLTYNGGELASLKSIAILSGGPAHNAGDFTACPLTDQRGLDRNDTGDGLCDIGAYEISSKALTQVLDLAVDISDKLASPLNGTVQATMTFTVVNKGSIQAHNVVLTGSIPALSWINITSLGSSSNSGSCVQSSTGFTCTIPTIDAYSSTDFFVAVVASQAGSFQVGAYVKSDEADNYNPDNYSSATIDIPTVAGSSVSGNNFAGASGGGAMDWLSLLLMLPALVRRRRRLVPTG